MSWRYMFLFTILLCAAMAGAQDDYLRWDAKEAKKIGSGMTEKGRVGGSLDLRIVNTNKAYNYKLRATWFTPEVIQATARHIQLQQRLSEIATRELVKEAESIDGTVIMVEIDPREGSGVIPLEWEAYLRPIANDADSMVAAVKNRELRKIKIFESVTPRDYSYERFWLVFPYISATGESLFSASVTECELLVRINGKEGTVNWQIPESVRRKMMESN